MIVAALAVAAAAAVTGCSTAADSTAPTTAGSPASSGSSPSTAASSEPAGTSDASTAASNDPQTDPRLQTGACYDYRVRGNDWSVPDVDPVPCDGSRTAVTLGVWPTTTLTDAGVTAADLTDVSDKQKVAIRRADDADTTRCEDAAIALLGSDFPTYFDWSLFYAAAPDGDVVRCDLSLYAVQDDELALAPLPDDVDGVLSTVDGKYQYALCLNASTGRPTPCGDFGLLLFAREDANPDWAPWPGQDKARAAAEKFCASQSSDAQVTVLEPVKQEWNDGTGMNRCFLPAARWRSIAEAEERS